MPLERPSSMDETGKRVFLYPAKVKGFYKNLRTGFYIFLLFVFLVIPWTTFDDQQTLLFDLAKRQFTFFGTSFSAHDAPLIFFPLILATLGLGFVTSVWGRVWCGWACPQTVFLESIFRRIDQWVLGSHTQRMKLDREKLSFKKFSKKGIKWLLFTIICSHIAHSFTAYFVGAKRLFWITTSSPTESWEIFVFVQILTAILLFNFGWFREQFCIIMCPYGRFQSVLMGNKSLAVLYDEKRGEPRRQKKQLKENEGDCVDCYKCVSACPMGIDIRRGLQMECIACTACIDACDEVMQKIKKPKGLIRYSSLERMSGKPNNRPGVRSVAYLGILIFIASIFVYILQSRKSIDIKVLRGIETPYTVVGEILINHFRLVVANQGKNSLLIESLKVDRGSVVSPSLPLRVGPGEIKRVHFFLKLEKSILDTGTNSKLKIRLPVVIDGRASEVLREVTVLQP